ncbi:MAG: hypothetical protein JXQ87_08760 [Bacteroidia bacterium]
MQLVASHIINHEAKAVIATFKGDLLMQNAKELGVKYRIMAKGLGYGFILDIREANIFVNQMDIENWFNQTDSDEFEAYKVPTAHVYSEKNRRIIEFTEKRWSKKGAIGKCFDTLKAAKEFILSQVG